MSNCTHQKTFQNWVPGTVDDWGTEDPGHFVTDTVSLCEDIDTHRYRCKACGHTMYYSGAARAYHEEGKLSHVDGLDR